LGSLEARAAAHAIPPLLAAALRGEAGNRKHWGRIQITLIADPINHSPLPISSAIADRQTFVFGKAVSAATDILNTKVWLEAVRGPAGDEVCYLRLC
jgi:hypothetical protein